MSNDTNGTSSAASCNNGHVFFYAGTPPIPDGFPCACGLTKYRASTTNDPQAAYGKKREPMLSDDLMSNWKTEPSTDLGFKSYFPARADEVRSFYEHLIASGELIVKSELVAFLNTEDAITSSGNQLRQDILDHINKKGSTTP